MVRRSCSDDSAGRGVSGRSLPLTTSADDVTLRLRRASHVAGCVWPASELALVLKHFCTGRAQLGAVVFQAGEHCHVAVIEDGLAQPRGVAAAGILSLLPLLG